MSRYKVQCRLICCEIECPHISAHLWDEECDGHFCNMRGRMVSCMVARKEDVRERDRCTLEEG